MFNKNIEYNCDILHITPSDTLVITMKDCEISILFNGAKIPNVVGVKFLHLFPKNDECETTQLSLVRQFK